MSFFNYYLPLPTKLVYANGLFIHAMLIYAGLFANNFLTKIGLKLSDFCEKKLENHRKNKVEHFNQGNSQVLYHQPTLQTHLK